MSKQKLKTISGKLKKASKAHANQAKQIEGVISAMPMKKSSALRKISAACKAAAKRKFKVYPSAYANMYASAVCSGKVTPGGKKKPKKKASGGMIESNKLSQERKKVSQFNKGGIARGCGAVRENKRKKTKYS